ncbi:unnamed protein product [Adineta ricciae]|uniref:Uncharacterized protein n=1 Tax=Adineta ricciae TaxID=249248 RepID=A0A815UAE3_ADIRI|nr:unnamed protein product [Adineta ricciae]CAF1513576.1 unnamed protein product [Adineta ricciae]
MKLKKQCLSKKHRVQRIACCRQYSYWATDGWRKVIFGDESPFYVLKRKLNAKYRELMKKDCIRTIQQVNADDGGKRAISGQGRTLSTVPIIRCFGKKMISFRWTF